MRRPVTTVRDCICACVGCPSVHKQSMNNWRAHCRWRYKLSITSIYSASPVTSQLYTLIRPQVLQMHCQFCHTAFWRNTHARLTVPRTLLLLTSVGVVDNGVVPNYRNVELNNVLHSVAINGIDVIIIDKFKSTLSVGPDILPPLLFKKLRYWISKPFVNRWSLLDLYPMNGYMI